VRLDSRAGPAEKREGAEILPTGKLPLPLLEELLETYTSVDTRVLVGARVGEDATVIDFGDSYLVAKTDPITFVTEDVGIYAINVNANDIACTGGRPKWFLASILLPEGATNRDLVDRTFEQISRECKRLGIAFCGGHTEVTGAVNHLTVVGCMLGEVPKERLITSAGAQVGDVLLLTKGIAIEATSIIAREKYDELVDLFSVDFVERCKGFLWDPGISVLRDAQAALAGGVVHAFHDPTEGGLATGLHELARAAEVGLLVDYDRIPIFPESKLLCDEYDLDPLGVIASGALLIAAPRAESDRLLQALERAGIEAAAIGTVTEKEEGCRLRAEGETLPLPLYERDEITRLFE
jgi:hydrogenase maturation factor